MAPLVVTANHIAYCQAGFLRFDFKTLPTASSERFEPGFPVFAQLSRDGLAFFLTEHTGDCPVGGLIHWYVPDVDVWFEEFRRKGVRVQEPPNETLPGLRSMTVVDPDGNKLHICTRLLDWDR